MNSRKDAFTPGEKGDTFASWPPSANPAAVGRRSQWKEWKWAWSKVSQAMSGELST